MDKFYLIDSPIEEFEKFTISPQAGAQVSFNGLVRNRNEGRDVKGLSYSAYEELAIKEGEKIMKEARARFEIIGMRAIHRIGELKIGESAVLVEVTSEHRREAFDACHWIIDEIKHRVPIWKKEQYISGESEWVMCHHTH